MMLDYLYEYGLFLAQAVTFVVAVLLLFGGIVSIAAKQRAGHQDGHIEVRELNERYKVLGKAVNSVTEEPAAIKAREKEEKKAAKRDAKAAKKRAKTKGDSDSVETPRKRLFVLNFEGDLRASAVDNLREEISVVLSQTRESDEVLVRLESPGGVVHGYGLAASQLQRIRKSNVKLTVAVDKVAASGGYMMACVADRIVAAPFAVLGSIGVLAQLPNFHRLLKKNDIDFELLTAGEYKRTLTLFGENTQKGREKFAQELEETHALFKSFVSENRPVVDIEKVATGEVWYGQQAVDVGLIDEISTSDDLIQTSLADADVIEVRYVQRKNWQEKLGMAAEGTLERGLDKLLQREQGPHY